jgi:Ser/Thr protein kinase RdoA (MazF antagonist)
MWEPSDSLLTICRHWFVAAPEAIHPIASSGWSGVPVLAVTAAGREYILKRFTEGTTRRRAEWVHALLAHCGAACPAIVPEVIRGRDGGTLHEDAAGGLWELVVRGPGEPCDDPTPARRAAAAAALASLHAAAEKFSAHVPYRAASPGVDRRRAQLAALLVRPWNTWPAHDASGDMPERLRRAAALLAAHGNAAYLARIAALDPGAVVVQPVLRDVWAEHVLFLGDHVAAVIDWHASGIDTPATDIARLTGSWPAAAEHRLGFLEAYAGVRPVSEAERRLVPYLDTTGVICAIDNWLRWTLEEQRRFTDGQRVRERIDRLLARLPEALDELQRQDGLAATWP